MKYLGYFFYKDGCEPERQAPPAAVTKQLYIAHCLSALEKTEIISASGVIGKRTDGQKVKELSDNLSVRYFFSLGRKNNYLGKIGTLLIRIQLLLFLLINAKKNEKIVVYHSLGYMSVIKIAHKLKKFHLVLEIEEIYADVTGDMNIRRKELSFFNSANSYIFPTKLLDEIINTDSKPSIIIHGTYQIEQDRNCNIFKESLQGQSDSIIHCVYAGTLDPRKGGAAAAAAAGYLPDCYHIHILGFGSEKQIQDMKDLISSISSQSKARITYDGLLSGEDYIRFIQSCDIGLSTQDPTAAFNATSFPSKILSYLANGLRVVSIKIPAIEESAVGDMLYYYTKQTPEEIANAIKSVNIDEYYNSRERISKLSNSFERELKTLLEEF